MFRRSFPAGWRGAVLGALLAVLASGVGCGRRETPVERGNREQVLLIGNGDEVKDLDPHTVTGVPEHNVMDALFEGLVTLDPRDLTPAPGVAERWEISPDGLVYTFHLRKNARWSNGEPVTARDFLWSHQRILTAKLAAEYANMLYVVEGAEDYRRGRITDFARTGFEVVDDFTYRIRLHTPAPYLLGLIGYHYSWSPVHRATVEKYGGGDRRGALWTRPGRMVSNGAFALEDWRLNSHITLRKNPYYWDASRVRLNAVKFYPISSMDTEERAFRNGLLHVSYDLVRTKLESYRRVWPEALRLQDYLGVNFYRLNVTRGPLRDRRVRRALALAVDREALVKHVLRDQSEPAYHHVPADVAGYTSRHRLQGKLDEARALLAEAGFPGGQGLPVFRLNYNTSEKHKSVAEAIQAMWRERLGVQLELANAEWKVFLDNQKVRNYDVSRAGWIGDYLDPKTFLEMWKTGDGNNDTGWSDARYDALIDRAGRTKDAAERLELFQQAEAILLEELPIVPLFFYKRVYLVQPSVANWSTNLLSYYGLKEVFLVPQR